jgi:hypothetical protein
VIIDSSIETGEGYTLAQLLRTIGEQVKQEKHAREKGQQWLQFISAHFCRVKRESVEQLLCYIASGPLAGHSAEFVACHVPSGRCRVVPFGFESSVEVEAEAIYPIDYAPPPGYRVDHEPNGSYLPLYYGQPITREFETFEFFEQAIALVALHSLGCCMSQLQDSIRAAKQEAAILRLVQQFPRSQTIATIIERPDTTHCLTILQPGDYKPIPWKFAHDRAELQRFTIEETQANVSPVLFVSIADERLKQYCEERSIPDLRKPIWQRPLTVGAWKLSEMAYEALAPYGVKYYVPMDVMRLACDQVRNRAAQEGFEFLLESVYNGFLTACTPGVRPSIHRESWLRYEHAYRIGGLMLVLEKVEDKRYAQVFECTNGRAMHPPFICHDRAYVANGVEALASLCAWWNYDRFSGGKKRLLADAASRIWHTYFAEHAEGPLFAPETLRLPSR